MEQIWHDQGTIWSRYGTTHSIEQTWHKTLYGADMARDTPWSRYGMAREQYGADLARHTLYRADLARDTPWSRYGMTREQYAADFLDKLPVVHLVAIFLACYGTHSVTNKSHAKAWNSKNYLSTERCTSRVCHS